MAVHIRRFGKTYVDRDGVAAQAVADVDLDIEDGEIVTVVGPSGCGKTTLLNCLAGLVDYDAGTIEIGGRPVLAPGPDRAVVFQHPSLLPWRNAIGNVRYGMELQRTLPKAQIDERARWALDLVGLTDVAKSYPPQLSGGMQQRVNLARALATRPQVLLMDEPFGALDALTKAQLQTELMRIVSELGQTVFFITHDIAEAIYLGDRVAVMGGNRPGRMLELVTVPFDRPRRPEVRREPEFALLYDQVARTLGVV